MGLLHERLIYLKSTMLTHRNYALTTKGMLMKLSDLPANDFWVQSQPIIVCDVTPTPPISVRWFSNWQRAATFTLDIELDWGRDPVFMIEFVFGIGFQVGFALVVSK